MILNKMFYVKSKSLDFHIKILFLDFKIYFGSFLSWLVAFFNLTNYFSLYNLLTKNSNQSILIVELNNFHSEIFPSWLFYLRNLSFDGNICFASSKEVYKINPFSLLEKTSIQDIKFYQIDPKIIITCYIIGLFRKFKKVIFNSEICYFSPLDQYKNLLDIFTKKNNLRNSLFLSHNILQTLVIKNNFIDKKKQLLTLSPTISKDTSIDYIFPLINNNPLSHINKNTFDKLKVFVSCGNIKINCKDSDGLILTLEKTKNIEKTVNIIGKAPKNLINNQSINYFPRSTFVELRSILEKSHFIFFLLSEDVSYQYKFNNLSGSFPLALNFNLIPIIEESFAKFYLLNETNAILYKKNELNRAIVSATSMNYEKYISMQNELYKLKQEIYNESLKNLNQIFM